MVEVSCKQLDLGIQGSREWAALEVQLQESYPSQQMSFPGEDMWHEKGQEDSRALGTIVYLV